MKQLFRIGLLVLLASWGGATAGRAAVVRPLSCSPGGERILLAREGENSRGFICEIESRRWTELAAVVGSLNESWNGKNILGVKIIDKTGARQYPAVADLERGIITPIGPGAVSVGFPAFSGRRLIFPRNRAVICREGSLELRELALAAAVLHHAAPSPDGRRLAVISGGRLKILDWNGKTLLDLPAAGTFPAWSPDSRRVAAGGENITIAELSGREFRFGEAASSEAGPFYTNPRWLDDGSGIVFISRSGREGTIATSLVGVSPEGEELWSYPLEGIAFADPLPLPGGRIVLAGEEAALMYRIEEDGLRFLLELSPELIDARLSPPPPPPVSQSESLKTIKIVDVPYIHQLYDTPNWSRGYNMCGPASCVMAAQYYRVFPSWPTEGEDGISPWGNYLPGLFEHNGTVYDLVTNDSNPSLNLPSRGAHGFMHTEDGAGWKLMEEFLLNQQLGTDYRTYPSWDDFVGSIDQGTPCVISTNLTGGHIIVGTGYREDGSIIANDPYGDKNRGYPNGYGEGAIYDWPGFSNGNQSLNLAKLCIAVRAGDSRPHDSTLVIDDSTVNASRCGFERDPSPDWRATDHFGYASTGDEHPEGNGLYYLGGTEDTGAVISARWWFDIERRGIHHFRVFIPSGPEGKVKKATYTLQNGRRNLQSWKVDQSRFSDQWVELGRKWLSQGRYSLQLDNREAGRAEIVIFDAVSVEGRGIGTD